MSNLITKQELIKIFQDIGVLNKGPKFILKSGAESEYYFNFRILISYPALLKSLAEYIIAELGANNNNLLNNHNNNYFSDTFDLVCGVPLSGIPISVVLSQLLSKPMILKRESVKAYGKKNLIDGIFNDGDKVLIVEDVVTTGGSLLSTIADLEKSGLKIGQIVIILSRNPEAIRAIQEQGYSVLVLFQTSDFYAE